MSRRELLFCDFTLIICLTLGFLLRPSYISAEERDPGFTFKKYLLIEDPKIAASQMLADAQKYGIDVSKIPASSTRISHEQAETIRINNHKVSIRTMDSAFIDEVNQSMEQGASDLKITCIVACNRGLSLNERADLMAGGIRIYTYGRPGLYSIIARITYGDLSKLMKKEYFSWAGKYSPELKYGEGLISGYDGEYFQVVIFEKDREEFRAELEQLNVEILRYREFSNGRKRYSIKCNGNLIHSIAEFWWVKGISTTPEVKSLQIDPGAGQNGQDIKTGTNLNNRFRPQDSRLLIGGWVLPEFDGYNWLIGQFDKMSFWGHADFQGRIHTETDSAPQHHHPAAVAGIILGEKRTLDPTEGYEIGGIVPRASILSKRASTAQGYNHVDALEDFVINDIRVANFSVRMKFGYGFSLWYYVDAEPGTYDFDRYADEELLVSSCCGKEYI